MTPDLPFSIDNSDRGWALSPLDGRYRSVTHPLTQYLSEDAVNRLRIYVEIEWLVFISENNIVPGLTPLSVEETAFLRALPTRFDDGRRGRLAALEAQTRHDVKAVEYLIREYLTEFPTSEGAPPLSRYAEAVHLLCTSEDINNLTLAIGLRGALRDVWIPAAQGLVDKLVDMAGALANTPMLSRTHGQSATPTTLGKEMSVFAWRLRRQLRSIREAEYLGKFNGATGTFSAHTVVLPGSDWMDISKRFVESLGLTWNPVTTQIESHDFQGEIYDAMARFNRISHNLATDMWTYISLGYFRQELSAQGSTGSSTMPHKVNPIRFENAEANLELSNATLDVLSQTLLTSRMQRDLTDSSMQRNIGVALGYSLVALDGLTRGLNGVSADEDVLAGDLRKHWEVISEAIQQALRVAQLRNDGESAVDTGDQSVGPYELLKEATRGKTVNQADLMKVVDASNMQPDLAEALHSLTPSTYIGLAEAIAQVPGK